MFYQSIKNRESIFYCFACVKSELWRYTSQPQAQVNLESRVNLESTTTQIIFFYFIRKTVDCMK